MRDAIIRLKDKRETMGQHPGLLLQRYLSETATGKDGNPDEKLKILRAAIQAAQNQEVIALYKAALTRWKESQKNSLCKTVHTSGRMIIGLGSANVLETGITLHHTYGMPFLPGSALKGLAAHYCASIWGEVDEKFKLGGEYHTLLFGTTDESGCIVFHDGWYELSPGTSPLNHDVMTPHHPQWLDGKVAPSDFDSPTPVPFLSVEGSFTIALSWNGPESSESEKWTSLASQLLLEALDNWGIGGKTSSGYGRMTTKKPVFTPSITKEKKPATTSKLKANDQVQAVLLEEKTKNGGWKAEIVGEGLKGHIVKTEDVPNTKKAGDVVTLRVASVNSDNTVSFNWPKDKK